MYRRYRYFIYFLGALVLGSFLLDWVTNSVRVPSPSHPGDGSPIAESQPAGIAAPPAPPADSFGSRPPSYAPSYVNPSVRDEERPKPRESQPSDGSTPPGISNSSDLPTPPPIGSSEVPDTPDRDKTTTSPKSSNAALREIIKPKGR